MEDLGVHDHIELHIPTSHKK